MSKPPDRDVTELLRALGAGNDGALDELFGVVYGELRRLAHQQRQRWIGEETLNTTALIHEAYLKLARGEDARWQDRGHFFAVASKAMRHILIDRARRSRAAKRGGKEAPKSLSESDTPEIEATALEDLLALDEALDLLQAQDARQAQVVECRFFGGLGVDETAEAVGVSSATVKRDWRAARVWLYDALGAGGAAG